MAWVEKGLGGIRLKSSGRFVSLCALIGWGLSAWAHCPDHLTRSATYHRVMKKLESNRHPSVLAIGTFQRMVEDLYHSNSISVVALQQIAKAWDRNAADPVGFLAEKIVTTVKDLAARIHGIEERPEPPDKLLADSYSAQEAKDLEFGELRGIDVQIQERLRGLRSAIPYLIEPNIQWLMSEPAFYGSDNYFQKTLEILDEFRPWQAASYSLHHLCRRLADQNPFRCARLREFARERPQDEHRWIVETIKKQNYLVEDDYEFMGEALSSPHLNTQMAAATAISETFLRNRAAEENDILVRHVSAYLESTRFDRVNVYKLVPLIDETWERPEIAAALKTCERRRTTEYRWLVKQVRNRRIEQLPLHKRVAARLFFLPLRMLKAPQD